MKQLNETRALQGNFDPLDLDLECDVIARVLGVDGIGIGMGTLVDDKHMLTCAHVVNMALGRAPTCTDRPAQEVSIELPFNGTQYSAIALDWLPMLPNPGHIGLEDIVLLKLICDRETQQDFRPSTTPLAPGDGVRTFAVTRNYPDGRWVFARIAGSIPKGWVQINQSEPVDAHIEQGFSGSPVFFDKNSRVVGMVVACHDHRVEGNLPPAYMIPWQHLRLFLERAEVITGAEAPVAGRIVLEFTPRQGQRTDEIRRVVEKAASELRRVASSFRVGEYFDGSITVTFEVSEHDAMLIQKHYDCGKLATIAGCKVRSLFWDATYIPITIEAALDSTFDADTRVAAIKVLGKLPNSISWFELDRVVRALIELTNDRSQEVQRAAAETIKDLGSLSILTLTDILTTNERYSWLAPLAARATTSLPLGGAWLLPASLAVADANLKCDLLDSVTDILQVPISGFESVASLLSSTHKGVALRAKNLLVAGGQHSVTVLMELLKSKREPSWQLTFLDVVESIDRKLLSKEDIAPALYEFAEVGNLQVREKSIILLGTLHIRFKEVNRILNLGIRDSERAIRIASLQAALQLASPEEQDLCRGLEEQAYTLLGSSDFASSSLAFKFLAALRLPVNPTILNQMLGVTDESVRHAAIVVAMEQHQFEATTLAALAEAAVREGRTGEQARICSVLRRNLSDRLLEQMANSVFRFLPESFSSACRFVRKMAKAKRYRVGDAIARRLSICDDPNVIARALSLLTKVRVDVHASETMHAIQVVRVGNSGINRALRDFLRGCKHDVTHTFVQQVKSSDVDLWQGTVSFLSSYSDLFDASRLEGCLIDVYQSGGEAEKIRVLTVLSSLGVHTESGVSLVVREWCDADSAEVQWACLEAIVRYGPLIESGLIALLQFGDERLQHRAALACGLIGPKARATLPHLENLAVRTESVRTRSTIHFASVRISGDEGGGGGRGRPDFRPFPDPRPPVVG